MPRIISAPAALHFPDPSPSSPVSICSASPRPDRRGSWTASHQHTEWWWDSRGNPMLSWDHASSELQMEVLWATVLPSIQSRPELRWDLSRRGVYLYLQLNPPFRHLEPRPPPLPPRCAMVRPAKYHMSLLRVRNGFRFTLAQKHMVRRRLRRVARQMQADASLSYSFDVGGVPGWSRSWNFALTRQTDRTWIEQLVAACLRQAFYPAIGRPRDQGPWYRHESHYHISWH